MKLASHRYIFLFAAALLFIWRILYPGPAAARDYADKPVALAAGDSSYFNMDSGLRLSSDPSGNVITTMAEYHAWDEAELSSTLTRFYRRGEWAEGVVPWVLQPEEDADWGTGLKVASGLIETIQASRSRIEQDEDDIVSKDPRTWVGFSAGSLTTEGVQTLSTGPVIDIWYGSHQVFGQLGNPQRWVDILGNVSDPDGVGSLVYSLNGGSELPLSIGPNNVRLVSKGDFNVEIARTDLVSGLNQVVITATDTLSNATVATVTVEYIAGNTWPIPYTIDWSSIAAITDVAQIVDGVWTLETDSIRPGIIGYDRLVAIGDVSWDDYQVTVPITIHSTQSSNIGGVGVIARWQGHFQVASDQPATGWSQLGAYGYYRFRDSGNHLALRLNAGEPIKNYDVQVDFGTRYILKIQVETRPAGQGGFYKLKIWEDGQPEPGWHLEAQDSVSDLSNGSVLLVAHEADASFGDVSIVPLSDITSTLTVAKVGSGTVSVYPDQSDYAYGQVVTLTATANPGWSFDGWSGHLVGSTSPATLTITCDHVVTATFTVSGLDHKVFLPLVLR